MGLSASGLGSGLDVAGMTQQLVAAERTPKQQRLTEQMAKVEVSLSAYGQIKSSASGLQEMFEKFDEDDVFDNNQVTTSNRDFVEASVESNAQNGRYSIEVKAMAQSHRLASANSFDADPNAKIGSGDLVFTVGDKSMTVNIDPNQSSLKDVVTAINKAKDNPGVTATIMTDKDGAKIVFSSSKTGKENSVKIDASGATGELSKLSFDPATPDGNAEMKQIQPAQDAYIVIDGFSHVYSDTNKFEDVLEGVTLDVSKLTGTTGSGKPTDDEDVKNVIIEISNDTSKPKDAINQLVESYNGLFEMIEEQSKFDVEKKKGGPLVGDSLANSLLGQLRSLFNNPITGSDGKTYQMSDFGITTTREGVLEVDDEILEETIKDNYGSLSAFFYGDEGFLKKADKLLEGFIGSEGSLTNRENSLKSEQERIEDGMTDLNERMAAFEARTYKQLTAMDAAIAKMNTELSTMQSLLM
ncbi:flagellar hook protein [Photobacterium aquae]|uniref:Flagellar hook-associated protein 2 n=1 Tax=Photobacterium aquae TaxID=1195763 RepID=A0A0J1H251_9GAMM|nr:flagellar filament capping protein FliD [Photobacterium aquae]KLV05880.1 flagellar hook protein [Photobacterium aquae]